MKETQYRTFDELLDSVKIDLHTFDLEGMISSQQLIKVAMRVNYELGLKINPSKSKPIEINKGKGKLPEDFDVLNFALLCEGNTTYVPLVDSKTYTDGILEGTLLAQKMYMLTGGGSTINQYNETKTLTPGINTITHNLNTTNLLVQAFGTDGNLLSFEIEFITNNKFEINNNSGLTIPSVKFVVIGGRPGTVPSVKTSIQLVDNSTSTGAIYVTNGRRYDYDTLIPMRIEKSKSVSNDCFNLNSSNYYSAVLKNGFLVTNFDTGLVYINYQSLMEDDDGNLLVMDHPFANEFYEYALKQRIYENLLMNGENVAGMLQIVEQRLRTSRNNALSFINTPDFNEMKKVWEMNRKAQYNKYYDMFKS